MCSVCGSEDLVRIDYQSRRGWDVVREVGQV
jgi:hypothetical protein